MSTDDSVTGDDSCNNSTNDGVDFTFGFNNSRFSDCVLIIEILTDDVTHQSADSGGGDDASCSDSEQRVRVRELHVNSLLLSAKSPFFHKLSSNSMMGTEQRRITLRIQAAAEIAVMEILNYMYTGTLTARTPHALLDVLKLADKFQVVSCMRLCTSLLTKLPMTTKSALLYLNLPSELMMSEEVRLLVDASKDLLQAQYKDIAKVQDQILEMPLVGIEAILSSDALHISTEDELFDLVLKWTKTHYPNLEDQRKILSAHLGRYIRFPYMSFEKLREVQSCNVLDDDFVIKAIFDALVFKSKTPHHHITNAKAAAIEDSTSTNYRPFARRDYELGPVKVLEFEFPCQELVIYFDLTFGECVKLLNPSGYFYSETFDFLGQPYRLCADCFEDVSSRLYVYFGLIISSLYRCTTHAFDYEFAVRSKCTKKFVVEKSGSLNLTAAKFQQIHIAPWVDLKAGKGGLGFIDGILYIELKLRIKQ